jgi:hypothetical protein
MEEVRRGGDLARTPSSSPSRDVRLSSELDEPRLRLLGASCVSAEPSRITLMQITVLVPHLRTMQCIYITEYAPELNLVILYVIKICLTRA